MKVVIVLELKDNAVNASYAFNGDGHEEVEVAEAKFIELAKKALEEIEDSVEDKEQSDYEEISSFSDDDWRSVLDDGHLEIGNTSIQLTWANNNIKTASASW